MKFFFRQYRRPPAGVLQPSFSSLVAEHQFQSDIFQNEPHSIDEMQLQGIWQVDTSCKASSQASLIQNYVPKNYFSRVIIVRLPRKLFSSRIISPNTRNLSLPAKGKKLKQNIFI